MIPLGFEYNDNNHVKYSIIIIPTQLHREDKIKLILHFLIILNRMQRRKKGKKKIFFFFRISNFFLLIINRDKFSLIVIIIILSSMFDKDLQITKQI